MIVVNDASGLDTERNRDLREELRRVAQEIPNSVNEGSFELVKLPWEQYPNPALYLKKSIRTSDLSDNQFVQECEGLSKTAYRWHRVYFGELAERVIQSRK